MYAGKHLNRFRLEGGRGRTHRFSGERFQFHSTQQFEATRASPDGFFALHFKHERSAGFSERLFFDQREDDRSVLDGAAKSVPIGNWDTVGHAERNLAKVEHDDAESAGVEQVIGGFERMSRVMAAADPDQLRKNDTACGGGYGVERIIGIYISANLKF